MLKEKEGSMEKIDKKVWEGGREKEKGKERMTGWVKNGAIDFSHCQGETQERRMKVTTATTETKYKRSNVGREKTAETKPQTLHQQRGYS